MKKSFNTSMVIYNDRPTFEQYIESYKQIFTRPKNAKRKLEIVSSVKPLSKSSKQVKSKVTVRKTGKKIKLV